MEIEGFYAPVDMNDVINIIKSGRSVALKFEIFEVVRDSNGDIVSKTEITSTSAIQSFTQQQIACSEIEGSSTDAIETTNTAGTIEPRYDIDSGQFIGNWHTPSGEAGNCYTAKVSTADYTITAYFKLR